MKVVLTNKGSIDCLLSICFCIEILVVGPRRMLSENRGAVGQLEEAIGGLRRRSTSPRVFLVVRAENNTVSDNNDLAASRMEGEAAECRRLAAKFKQKAADAKLPTMKALFLRLERRYILMAEVNQREAERLRAGGRR
jgi:hypothetical protein